jgi:hypothetical protein
MSNGSRVQKHSHKDLEKSDEQPLARTASLPVLVIEDGPASGERLDTILERLVSPHQLIRYPARPSAGMSAYEAYWFNRAYEAAKEVLEISRGKWNELYVVRLSGGGESGFNVATADEITGDAMVKYYELADIVAAVRETIN